MSAYRSKFSALNKGLELNADSDSNVTSILSSHGVNEGVRTWRAGMTSASALFSPASPPDIFVDTESSLAYTASDTGTYSELEVHSPSGPRYLYYRVYTENGAIPSKMPVSPEDPYLARITAKSVAPPHTVSSLKRCLCRAETISDYQASRLFLSTSSRSPMDSGDRVQLLSASGPGSMPQESMALIVNLSESERRALATVSTSTEDSNKTPPAIRYLYYRFYTKDGAITSSQPADSHDSSFGRVDAVLVAPPHTVISLKRCLCSLEKVDDYESTSLFVAASCQTPMDNTDQVSILSLVTGPGMTPLEPMALVVQLPDPERLFYCTKHARGSSVHDRQSIAPRYLYYRLYTEDGAISSLRSLNPDDRSLGRIDARFVAPPHTAGSIKRCVATAEKLAYFTCDKLFIDTSSESPMDDELSLSILGDERPAITPEDSMAFVRLYFHQRVRSKREQCRDNEFLSVEDNEILNIAGPSRRRFSFVDVYDAVNALGTMGLVFQVNVDFIGN